jgi:hypothetical protein
VPQTADNFTPVDRATLVGDSLGAGKCAVGATSRGHAGSPVGEACLAPTIRTGSGLCPS